MSKSVRWGAILRLCVAVGVFLSVAAWQFEPSPASGAPPGATPSPPAKPADPASARINSVAASANAAVTESFSVPFVGGIYAIRTAQSYSGQVQVTVSGVGQASSTQYSDAFYLYTDFGGNPITPVRSDTWTLAINGAAASTYVAVIPGYRSDHIYTFVIALGAAGPIIFGVNDAGTTDNSGGFAVTVIAGSLEPLLVLVPGVIFPIPALSPDHLDADGCLSAPDHADATFADILTPLKAPGNGYADRLFFNYGQPGDGCVDSVHGRYNSADTFKALQTSVNQLDAQINAALSRRPTTQINIVAHSLGGLVATAWGSTQKSVPVGKYTIKIVTLDSPLSGCSGGEGGIFCTAAQVLDFPVVRNFFDAQALYSAALNGQQLSPLVYVARNQSDHFVTYKMSVPDNNALNTSMDQTHNPRALTIDDCSNKTISDCHGSVLSSCLIVNWVFRIFTSAPPSGPSACTGVVPITAYPTKVVFGSTTTTVSWNDLVAADQVWLSANGGPEVLYAGGASGSQLATFISSGYYDFTVYAGTAHAQALSTVRVQKLSPNGTTGPSVVVEPVLSPFIDGEILHTITVAFDGAENIDNDLFVRIGNGPRVLFTHNVTGAIIVPWIQSGLYWFTLVKNGATIGEAVAGMDAGLSAAATRLVGGSAAAGVSTRITYNDKDGSPAVACVSGPDGLSVPLSYSNSGAGIATLGGLISNGGATIYTVRLYESADGSRVTSVAAAQGQCTANVPLTELTATVQRVEITVTP